MWSCHTSTSFQLVQKAVGIRQQTLTRIFKMPCNLCFLLTVLISRMFVFLNRSFIISLFIRWCHLVQTTPPVQWGLAAASPPAQQVSAVSNGGKPRKCHLISLRISRQTSFLQRQRWVLLHSERQRAKNLLLCIKGKMSR